MNKKLVRIKIQQVFLLNNLRMKKIILILFCFISNFTFSQSEKLVLSHSLKEKNNYLNQIIPIANNETNEFSIFFIEAKKIYGYLLTEDYILKSSLISEIKSRKYKIFLEKKVFSDDLYSFLLTNKSATKFGVFNFSYITNTSEFKEILLELNDEKFIKTFLHNNLYYIITVTRKSSKLNLYSVDKEGSYTKRTIEFNSEKFNKIFKNSLYSKLTHLQNKKIDINNPNAIENTSEFKKIYVIDDKLLFSFDFNDNFTNVLSINLKTLDKEVKQFRKPFIYSESRRKRSNTFIYKDKFYMVAATKEKLIFNVKNFYTEELIKEFVVTKDDLISFKNTPVLIKLNRKVFEKKKMKTKIFLKKITDYNIGISTYEYNDKLQITIGGKSIKNNDQTVAMGVTFGLVGAILYSTLTSTLTDYNTYETSSSTYIKCVFDADFNHVKGKSKQNAFDKVIDYKNQKRLGIIKNEIIFKVKDHYLYGYFNNRKNELHLFKFEDDE